MQSNSLKFKLIGHGKDNHLKESIYYICSEWELTEKKESAKDLGITQQNNLSIKQHITNTTEAAKRMAT